MASHTSWSGDTAAQFTRYFRGLFRVMLCLCLWSGPTPMLHAHEKSGEVIDSNPDLAQHVQVCHSHDDCDDCQHWHLHFMLWGQVQPDSSDPVPQHPQPRDLQSEFAIAPSSVSVSSVLTPVDAPSWSFDLLGLANSLSLAKHWESAVVRAPIDSYHRRVSENHDVALLSMVARC